MRTFAEITADIERLSADAASFTADELAALSADIRAIYESVKSDGPGEDETGAEFFGTLTALRDGLRAVTLRQGEIVAEQADAEQLLADLDAEVTVLSGDITAEDADALNALDDDGRNALAALDADGLAALAALAAAPEVVEPVEDTPIADVVEITPPAPEVEEDRLERAASALRSRQVRQPAPAPEAPQAVSLVHAYDDGTPLDGPGLTRRLASAIGRYGNTPDREVRVASVTLNTDVERVENIADPKAWFDDQLAGLRQHRQASAAAPGVRQAAGTLCAPPLTDYSVTAIGSEDQPTRALFPTAGGSEADNNKTLEFVQALGFSGFVDANAATFGADNPDSATGSRLGIGSATATQNAAAGNASQYPKAPLAIACPTLVTCEMRLVWASLLWDNLGAAAWPELVAAGDMAGKVALAKEQEELRLQDWFDAADSANQVLAPQTTGQPYSGTHAMVQTLLTLATFDRTAKRDPNAQYVAIVPDWAAAALAPEMLAMLDIAAGTMSLEQAKAEIFTRFGITVGEYHDGFGKSVDARTTTSGDSTVLPALTASALVPQFPCSARIGLARDDAGFVRQGLELNLGVLRTQANIEANEYQTFYESGTRLCFRIPPIVADVKVNASSAVAAGVTPVDNCSGSGS